MFEAILERRESPQSHFGTGAFFSMALHGGAIALIFWGATAVPYTQSQKDLAVKFIKPTDLPPPPPPPPPKLASASPQPHQRELRRKTDAVVRPKQVPEEKQQEPEADYRPENTLAGTPEGQSGGVLGGVAGGVAGGVLGGTPGGVPGGQLGGALGSSVLPFGEGMTRPEKTHGEPPQYTREALAAGVQGNMLVKCVITIDGKLENCRIIKALPHMEKAVLDALSTWRYKPVHYQGRPVAVDYLIQIRLVIPH